jgi:hypothetical protein
VDLISESKIDLSLVEQLRSGKRVALYRSWPFFLAAIVFSAFALLLLAIISSFYLGEREEGFTRLPLLAPFAVFATIAIFFWRSIILSGIRFASGYLEYWDWLGRRRRFDFSEIIAVTLSARGTGTPASGSCPIVGIFQLNSASPDAATWQPLYSGASGQPTLALALTTELAQLCELTESFERYYLTGQDLIYCRSKSEQYLPEKLEFSND